METELKETAFQIFQRYNPKLVKFRDMPRPYQYAMIYYMAIDGEAWELFEDVSNEKLNQLEKHYGRGNEEFWIEVNKEHKKNIAKTLSQYIEKYGDEEFWIGEIPTQDAIKYVVQFDDEDEITEEWYEPRNKENPLYGYHENHPKENRWPCIINTTFEDGKNYGGFWQDGWHRFTTYTYQGAKMIPAIAYPEKIS